VRLTYVDTPEKMDWERVATESWHFGDKMIEVEVREWSKDKSRPYEKWYWGVALKLASEHTGYTPDELHQINKARHLAKMVTDPMTGKEITIMRGTSDADFDFHQQKEFYEAVQRDYAETLGLVIPDPNESIPAP